jgi:hypothetical protein
MALIRRVFKPGSPAAAAAVAAVAIVDAGSDLGESRPGISWSSTGRTPLRCVGPCWRAYVHPAVAETMSLGIAADVRMTSPAHSRIDG